MSLSTTPSLLSLVWSTAHGLSPFYADPNKTFPVADGVLVSCGVSGSAMGVSSVEFDDVTGEPLTFRTLTSVTAAGAMDLLGAWHFPAESCVVLAGVRNDSTAANVRVYAQRVYYDSTGALTADPLVTHTPSGIANGAWSAGPGGSSTSLYVMGILNTVIRTADFVMTGSVGSTGSPSVTTVFGSPLDRTTGAFMLQGRHGGAAMLVNAYQNSAGVGTADLFVAIHNGSTTSSSVSGTPLGAGSDAVMVDTRTLARLTIGTAGYYLVSNTSIVSQAPPTDTFVVVDRQRQPQVNEDPGYLDSHNDEYANFVSGGQRRRVRMWNPDTGAEVYGWTYGTLAPINLPHTGRMVARGEFWFNLNGATFQVWQGDFPATGQRWWVGVAGWSG